jgi:hypothetical protein
VGREGTRRGGVVEHGGCDERCNRRCARRVATAGPSVGAICLYASTGVDLIVDVQGSFTGAAYTGVIPDRFLDTRD